MACSRFHILPIAVLILLACHHSNANTSADNDTDEAYAEEYFISIATGYKQLVDKAPAVASIITEKDIRKTAATSVEEALVAVAGIHVSRSIIANKPIYSIRGIHSEENQATLIMIDGVPITHLFFSKAGSWSRMPIHAVERIEIIRGPGSAIYGADAMSGTINIITKNYEDIENEVGVRAGAFNTREAWWLQKAAVGKLETAFTVELFSSDGHDEQIVSDAQTFFDGLFFNAFNVNGSNAPGQLNTGQKSIDANVHLNYQGWQLQTRYEDRNEVGTGAGHASALDPVGEQNSDRLMVNLSYDFDDPAENLNWSRNVSVGYLSLEEKFMLFLFPINSVVPFPNQAPTLYESGVVGNPGYKEKHYYGQFTSAYRGLDYHHFRFGVGFRNGDLYGITETKNFTPTGIPLERVVDVSNDKNAVYILPHDRDLYYLFVQDEWNFTRDWSATIGFRYDHYSDVGTTFNPRVALVWETNYKLTTKLLYGRAFRAPSFAEQFLINNPAVTGNPDLEPETINTIELAFTYRMTDGFRLQANLYQYNLDDIIRSAPLVGAATRVHQNTAEQDGYGFETELYWSTSSYLSFAMSYSYQHSTDKDSGQDVANVPTNQIHLRSDWEWSTSLHFNADINWIDERKRPIGDSRPDLRGKTLVNLHLEYGNNYRPWSASIIVKNVFDEDAREPTSELIRYDLPQAGRALYGQFRLRF